MQQPTRRRFLIAAGSLAGAAAIGGAAASRQIQSPAAPFIRRSTAGLGTQVTLSVRHGDPLAAERAIRAAFDELAFLEHRLLSIYDPGSQVSRLNRDGVLDRAHPDLVWLLGEANRLSRQTGGAFDVTVQPLWETYAAAHRAGRLPSAAEVAAARALVDWRQLKLTSDSVRFGRLRMKLTLNGIAQGYVADRMLIILRGHGIEHALINAGEHAPLGESQPGDAWTIGIQHPRQADAHIALADLAGRCLATSGDYATPFSSDRRHHHIVDPRTGNSPVELASVSIVAPSAMQADGLSTAAFVLGPDRALELIRRTPQADAFFVLKDGGTIATPGFPLVAEGAA